MERRLVGVEDQSIENKPEPERDDVHGPERADERKSGNDAKREEYGRPRHHALIGPDQAQRLAIGWHIRSITGFVDLGANGGNKIHRPRVLHFVPNPLRTRAFQPRAAQPFVSDSSRSDLFRAGSCRNQDTMTLAPRSSCRRGKRSDKKSKALREIRSAHRIGAGTYGS